MRTIENWEVVETILEAWDTVLSHIKSKRKTKEQPYKKQEKQGKIRKTREKAYILMLMEDILRIRF